MILFGMKRDLFHQKYKNIREITEIKLSAHLKGVRDGKENLHWSNLQRTVIVIKRTTKCTMYKTLYVLSYI